MSKHRRAVPDVDDDNQIVVRFGGWHNGDNHRPGRAWHYVCPCGAIGKGQLLPLTALKRAGEHNRVCKRPVREAG